MKTCCCASIECAYTEQLDRYNGRDHPVMLSGLKGLVEPLVGNGKIFDNDNFSVRVAYILEQSGRALGACRIPVHCTECGALGGAVREDGVGGALLTAYASEGAHMCVARALDMAGLGSASLRLVSSDSAGLGRKAALNQSARHGYNAS